MKKVFFIILKWGLLVLLLLAVYNYLDMNFFQQSVKQRYIDESYFRPTIVDEFKKLEKKEPASHKTVDSMENITLEDVIVENSEWYIGERDLSGLREEWNYKVFDFVKQKYPQKAETIFKEYLKLKNEEIISVRKLEENFAKVTNEILAKNKNVKNTEYYKKFHTQVKAKKELLNQTQDVLRNRKIEVFGKQEFEELEKLSEEFIKNVNLRLVQEYSFTEMEVEEVKTNYMLGKLLLIP